MEGRGTIYEEMDCFDNNTFSQQPQVLITGSTTNSNCSVEAEELSEFNLFNQMNYQDFVNSSTTTTPDLLNLLHLPRCSLPHPSSLLPNTSFSDIMSSSSAAAVMYDPLFHLNFPLQQQQQQQQPTRVDEEFHIDVSGGMFYDNGIVNDDNGGGFDNGVFEFNSGVTTGTTTTTRKGRRAGKSRTFPTERERRVHFNHRFFDLKNLIPNPTKNDRASIVGEAIDYIKELLRTIEEFKMLVEKKRFGKLRTKKKPRLGSVVEDQDQEQEQEEDTVSYKPKTTTEEEQSSFNKNSNNNSLRCSWLKRKSKVTEVDVRIIDDEVTIKLVQKKKINCLLSTTKVLDQLQLDLHHVAGGQIGEHYSFLFNTKICEGFCVYASGIADTVMEVVEKEYMEAVPTGY